MYKKILLDVNSLHDNYLELLEPQESLQFLLDLPINKDNLNKMIDNVFAIKNERILIHQLLGTLLSMSSVRVIDLISKKEIASVIVMDYNLMSKKNGVELIFIAKDKYKDKIRNVKIILFSGNSNYICESELEVLARNNVEIVSKSNYGILIEKLQIEAK